jgi:glycosyltransferase involved in cell wall biosynthesis
MRAATFAIPGDINQKTGGYIYEKSLLHALRDQGRRVAHLQLPGSFPDAPPPDMAESVASLAALPADEPLILDGLVYGAIETAGLATVRSPLVAMIHHPLGLETGLPPARAAELLQREAANLALAAHVVVPSPHTKRILAADFSVPEAKISIALPGFAPPDPVRRPVDPPLILAVGLIAARKGHDVLIDALSRIADLPWQAQIAGGTHDADVAAALRAQATPLGDRLTFRGRMEEADLAALYRQATVFALATRYEGYGMVFGEALLHGLPIVTCAAGAVPETVPKGAGILVPVDDAAAFADALRALLTDHARREEMAATSAAAGHALPRWSDTAKVMGRVLDTL